MYMVTSTYVCLCVCLSVCLSVLALKHIPGSTYPIFTKFYACYVPMAVVLSAFHLQRRCDPLCAIRHVLPVSWMSHPG